jgi:hypothetical protein
MHSRCPEWVEAVRKRNLIWSYFFALSTTTSLKILGTFVPRRVFTQPGSKRDSPVGCVARPDLLRQRTPQGSDAASITARRGSHTGLAGGRSVGVPAAAATRCGCAAATRSDVVYDVVHVYRSGFFRLSDHLDRFTHSMAARRLRPPEDRLAIEAILHRRSLWPE